MPDAPVAAPAAPSSPGGGSSGPTITFGGGSSGASQPTPIPDVGAGSSAQPNTQDVPDGEHTPFEFKFDGDEEAYRENREEQAAKPEERLDAAKPFDPKIKEALKANPDLLKQVERTHYELRGWQKSGFKNAQAATKHLADLNVLADGLGRADGLKGLEAVRAEAQEWATTMLGFKNGDPAIVEQWFGDNPEGMSKLMGPALAKFAAQNPGAYAHEMSAIMAATLQSNGQSGFSPIQAFNFLVDKFGKDAEGAKWLNVLSDSFNAIFNAAKNQPKSEGTESPQIQQERQRIAADAKKNYQQSVWLKASPIQDSGIRQAISHAFSGLTISTDSRRDIEANAARMLREALTGDQTYKTNASALLQAQNDADFLKAYKSAITRHLPGIARKLRRTFAGINAPQRKAEAQSRTEAGGAVQSGAPKRERYAGPIVQGGPPPSAIDYSAMRQKFGRERTSEMLANHEFIWKGKDPETIFQW